MEYHVNGYIVLVDDEDADLLTGGIEIKKTAWKPYARRNCHPRLLHRLILARKEGRRLEPHEHTDHIKGNTLDNRRCNLRVATVAENARNRGPTRANKSGYKGVCWNKVTQKWMAYIWHGKNITLGYFHDAEEAARARDQAALLYHGEFAYLNFPEI